MSGKVFKSHGRMAIPVNFHPSPESSTIIASGQQSLHSPDPRPPLEKLLASLHHLDDHLTTEHVDRHNQAVSIHQQQQVNQGRARLTVMIPMQKLPTNLIEQNTFV